MRKIWNFVKFITNKVLKRRGHGISILIPFHCNNKLDQRFLNFTWLYRYWREQLPGAEIIIGVDHEVHKDKPFSKSCAVNDAFKKSHGDIIVIADADGYIDVRNVLYCAKEIRWARKRGRRLWFIPYRLFFRLNKKGSEKILNSSPCHPYKFSTPPPECYLQGMERFHGTSGSGCGHWYGALIQIMPREAFEIVGGWDWRFRGWGGEDHAAMRAMDTLYWPHKTLPSQVLHLWHETLFVDKTKNRRWENQEKSNDPLSHRYYYSQGNVARMRKLVNEFKTFL